MKASLDANFFVPAPNPVQRFYLSLEGKEGFYNELLIGLLNQATPTKDDLYDAHKLRGNSRIAFYSLIEGEEYAIQGTSPFPQQQVFQLGYEISEAGNYTITLSKTETLSDLRPVLKDLYENKEILLKEGDSYSFYSPAGKFNGRFTLDLSTASHVENKFGRSMDIPVYVYQGNLVMDFNNWKNFPVWYSIVNISGQESGSGVIENNRKVNINSLNPGCYLVKINSSTNSLTRKILVN